MARRTETYPLPKIPTVLSADGGTAAIDSSVVVAADVAEDADADPDTDADADTDCEGRRGEKAAAEDARRQRAAAKAERNIPG